jgi:DNA primase large subunit
MAQQKRSIAAIRRPAGQTRNAVHPPPFYETMPDGEISIADFEALAMSRKSVLRVIEEVCGYETPLLTSTKSLDEAKAKIEQTLAKSGLLDLSEKRNDAISHNILRLAYSRSADTKAWFVRNEERLFVYRLKAFQAEADFPTLLQFLKERDLVSVDAVVTAETNRDLYNDLIAVTAATERGERFYGLPFASIPPHLIGMRKVLIRAGIAYMPESELRFVAARKFRAQLEHGLKSAPQCLALARADPRLGPLLDAMGSITWTGQQRAVTLDDGERLDLSTWKDVSKRSFPPCMRSLVDTMFNDRKHLKYKGRTQLQPFMKSAGFSLEDSKTWWKLAMTQDPTVDTGKFDKEYMYGINYTYGKCGNMKEKSCFKCQTIIQQTFPAGEERHGCPFHHLDQEQLTNMLREYGVTDVSRMQDILLKVKDHAYELACRSFFQAKHPGNNGDEMGNHPMEYYKESAKYYAAKEKQVKSVPVKSEATPVKAEPVDETPAIAVA